MTSSTASNPAPASSASNDDRSPTLAYDLLPRRGPSRLLGVFAVGWLISAVVHFGIFIADDQPWSGAVSWRKPIVFSLSIGLLLWTFGWILDRLPHRARTAWILASVMAVASSAENVLIAFQQWRGRPSHFNGATAGDEAIFNAMGGLVAVMSLCLIALVVWTLIQRPTDRLERLAIFAGMGLVVSGLGIGQWIVGLGTEYFDRFNEVPEAVINGEAGVAKFPHAVAFHGIQLFMVAAAMLRRSVAAGTAGQSGATMLMRATVVSYIGAMVFSVVQSFGGRAPFDLDVVSAALLAASLIGLALAGAGIVTVWWRSRSIPTERVIVHP